MAVLRVPILPPKRLTQLLHFRRAQQFSTTASNKAKNRVYTSVRTPEEFSTINLLSASSNRPLVTLWTASWCPSCAFVSPILKELIENDGVGENEGGVGYAEIELDAVTIGDLGMRYMISSMPTLMAFSRQEPRLETRVTRLNELKDKEFLKNWIEEEARRGGKGGAGGSLFGGLFGRQYKSG